MKEVFLNHLIQKYPSLVKDQLEALISLQLFSPYCVELPKNILTQAQSFVAAVYGLRQLPQYKEFLGNEISARSLIDPGNKSICMSFDFHINERGELKLIEINTNAAFLAMGYELYESQKIPQPVEGFHIRSLKACIEMEMDLFSKGRSAHSLSIIDEKPQEQRLYVEFLLYQALFKSWGWNVKIEDYHDLSEVDFVYNRFTDFYFEQPESSNLKELFLNKEVCFSPNPFEYLMLADKQRMIDWNSEQFWQQMGASGQLYEEKIRAHLPKAFSVNKDKLEEAWSQRKNYFFKPKRAFGSKQSYKGASMSRRVLEDIAAGDFIAQEYVPAPEYQFKANEAAKKLSILEEVQKFKCDLRFYAYQDQVQMVIARLYQGQATNAKTLGGGFACIKFSE